MKHGMHLSTRHNELSIRHKFMSPRRDTFWGKAGNPDETVLF